MVDVKPYAGEYITTVWPHDVAKQRTGITGHPNCFSSCLGRLQECDIGKQIWKYKGTYGAESDSQLRERKMMTEGDFCFPVKHPRERTIK